MLIFKFLIKNLHQMEQQGETKKDSSGNTPQGVLFLFGTDKSKTQVRRTIKNLNEYARQRLGGIPIIK